MRNHIVSPHSNKHGHVQTDGVCQPKVRRKHGAIIGGDRLVWRSDNGGLSLHHGQSRKVLAEIVADKTWNRVFRIQFPDGRVSDMASLTWIKDAAIAIALRSLNSKPQDTARDGPQARQNRSLVSHSMTSYGTET